MVRRCYLDGVPNALEDGVVVDADGECEALRVVRRHHLGDGVAQLWIARW